MIKLKQLFFLISFLLASREVIAQEITVSGIFDIVTVDYEDNTSTTHYELQTDDRHYILEFGSPIQVTPGTSITVVGVLEGERLRVKEIRSSITTRALVSNPPRGDWRIAVILLNFSNNLTENVSIVNAQALMDTSFKSFYQASSYNLFTPLADVIGYYTITALSTPCSYTTWASQARALATEAGVNLSVYRKIIYSFPKTSACSWAGLGGSNGAYINGSFTLRTVGHEFGHVLGMNHANSVTNSNGIFSPFPAGNNYGDNYDIMGGSTSPLNAFHRERLGWLSYLDAPPLTPVTSNGQYLISSILNNIPSSKALTIPHYYEGYRGFYYVEFRSNGLLLHIGDHAGGVGLLLDINPTSTNDYVLNLGQTFFHNSVSIRPISINATEALVEVNLNSLAAPQSPGKVVFQ